MIQYEIIKPIEMDDDAADADDDGGGAGGRLMNFDDNGDPSDDP